MEKLNRLFMVSLFKVNQGQNPVEAITQYRVGLSECFRDIHLDSELYDLQQQASEHLAELKVAAKEIITYL